jgi:hypothetical protein
MRVNPSDAKNILNLLMGNSKNGEENSNAEKKSLDAFTILSLPSRLRKTAVELHRIRKATAVMIAKETGEDEIVERSHLEELLNMGYLKLIKINDEDFFCLN